MLLTTTSVEECLATIQVIQRNSTGVDNTLVGNLRVWLWIPDKVQRQLSGFLIDLLCILDTGYVAFHLYTRKVRILSFRALRSHQIRRAGHGARC